MNPIFETTFTTEVVLVDTCSSNSLSLNNNAENQVYYLDSAPMTITAIDFSATEAACPIVLSLEVYDNNLQTWLDHSQAGSLPFTFDPATGTVTIESSDYAAFSMWSEKLRLVASGSSSAINDEF